MSRIIQKDDAAKIERWQCPDVDESTSQNISAKSGLGLITAEKIEKIQRQAFKQAYDEGYASGFNKGKTDGEQNVKQQLEAVTLMLDALSHPLSQINEEVEQELVNLAILLAKQVVRREIKAEPGEIVAIVREAVSLLPIASNTIQVRVHPDDYVVLLKVFHNHTDAEQWRLLEDISLQRGDCKVSTDISSVDATLETRFSSVLQKMFSQERSSDQSHEDQ